ncbi:hypothetical protein VNI00_001614 [Paramarasmius palmivorus]|uniref:Ras-domain-containing protein n=1 Tax=Paramarasmius palmivorus TaxID=297713 RepID=A0AAW0E1M7_9AGAR
MPLNDYEADATELLETYVKDHSQHTIGVEFSSRTIKLGEKRIKLQLWDTAGQERFRSVTRSYYRGAAGAILVYDITNRASFTNLSRWLADARALGSPHLVTVLVGNKSDREEDREVEWAEASRWAAENDVHFLEASSLTGENVEAPFMLAARSILLSIESGALDPEKAGSGVSYGDRALRRVNSSSRLSFGSLSGRPRKNTVKLKVKSWTAYFIIMFFHLYRIMCIIDFGLVLVRLYAAMWLQTATRMLSDALLVAVNMTIFSSGSSFGSASTNATSFAPESTVASSQTLSSQVTPGSTSTTFVSRGSSRLDSPLSLSTLASPASSQTLPLSSAASSGVEILSSTVENSPISVPSGTTTMATTISREPGKPGDSPAEVTSTSPSTTVSNSVSETSADGSSSSASPITTSSTQGTAGTGATAPVTSPPSTPTERTDRTDTGSNTSPPAEQQGNASNGRPTSTSTSIVFVKGTQPSTTMVSTITVEPESTFPTPVGVVVTQPDGQTTLTTPALVTVLSTSQEPDGSFITYTHTIANPTGFDSNSGARNIYSVLKNEGAVAGIFLAVGIVITSLAVCAFLLFRKRRRRARTKKRWIEDMQRRPPAPPDSPDNPFMDQGEPPVMSAVDPRDRVATRSPDRFYLDDGGPLIPLNANSSNISRMPPANVHHQYKAPYDGPFSDANAYHPNRDVGRAITTPDDGNHLQSPSPLLLSRQSTPSLYPPTVQDDYEDVDLNGSSAAPRATPHDETAHEPVSPATDAPPRPPRSILRSPSKVYNPYAPMTPPDSVDGSQFSESKPPSPEVSRTGSDNGHRNSLLLSKGNIDTDIFTRPTLLNVRPRSRDSDQSK